MGSINTTFTPVTRFKLEKMLNERNIKYANIYECTSEHINIKKNTENGLVFIEIYPDNTIHGYSCRIIVTNNNHGYMDTDRITPINEILDSFFG